MVYHHAFFFKNSWHYYRCPLFLPPFFAPLPSPSPSFSPLAFTTTLLSVYYSIFSKIQTLYNTLGSAFFIGCSSYLFLCSQCCRHSGLSSVLWINSNSFASPVLSICCSLYMKPVYHAFSHGWSCVSIQTPPFRDVACYYITLFLSQLVSQFSYLA